MRIKDTYIKREVCGVYIAVPVGESAKDFPGTIQLNSIANFVWDILATKEGATEDEVASKFRKMLMIERYRNQELNKIYEDLFVNGAVQYEKFIFSSLITAGVIKKENPHIVALRFYTPIFYLLQKYDMHPEQEEEAKRELISVVKEFCETYKG